MRASRFFLGLFVVTAIHFLLAAPTAQAINIEFSNFVPFDNFPNASLPQTIVADGHPIELTKYNGSSDANAFILDFFPIGAEPKSLFLAASIRAEVLLTEPATDGFFVFLDQGGTNFLELNGELMDFTDTALTGGDLHFVGGVGVSSSAIGELGARRVELEGPINSIAFVGQELQLDSINLTLVPEPATWLMLALGGAMTLALRRRRTTWR